MMTFMTVIMISRLSCSLSFDLNNCLRCVAKALSLYVVVADLCTSDVQYRPQKADMNMLYAISFA